MSRMILFRLLSNVRAVAVVAFMVAMPVDAMAELVADFYAGKTISIYVCFTAGGGYDIYARQLAPFLTKHIPGKPAVIVKNMPGAGSREGVQPSGPRQKVPRSERARVKTRCSNCCGKLARMPGTTGSYE